MNFSVIVIGDELLIGQVTDTNSGWIARHLTPYGWKTQSVRVIADDEQEITRAIDAAFAETDVVLMTGGLGPTKDDITKATLCRYFGGEMVLSEPTLRNVEEVLTKRGLQMNELNHNQAMVPSSCRVIQNTVGTAPLMWFERGGKVLVSMPGVPFETETMMRNAVIPELMKRFMSDVAIEYRTFVVIDYSESVLALTLTQFEEQMPDFVHLAYLPKPGVIRLRLSGCHANRDLLSETMECLEAQLHAILGKNIICNEDKQPAEILGDLLRKHGLTVSTAESCTGGNVAHTITEIAGSSEYFAGSVVSYCNEVKKNVLGVDEQVLNTVGAVSEPTVKQMSLGVSSLMNTDCAMATSGIAGPGGAVPGKPVGTVWMSAKCGDRLVTECRRFPGDRARVIERTTTHVTIMLIKLLMEL
ncbi:MAG: CinA family nicotinamide mononucleotide deamidase-related protein [Muribaculaceae bacterium]